MLLFNNKCVLISYFLFVGFAYAETPTPETPCVGSYIDKSILFTSKPVGDQFNRILFESTGRWGYGISSKYKSEHAVTGYTTYSVGIPKKVALSDGAGEVDIELHGDVITIPTDNKWQAVFIQKEYTGCVNTNGKWEDRLAFRNPGSVQLILSGKGLHSGNYTLKVPFILAWGTSKDGIAARDFRNTWKQGNVPTSQLHFTGFLGVDFKVENKCDFSSEDKFTLNHGALTPDVVAGNRATSKNVKISCREPAAFRFQFHPQRVHLGNGVDSSLSLNVSGKEHTENPVNITLKNQQFNVVSTLSGKDNGTGLLQGSSVLTVLYD